MVGIVHTVVSTVGWHAFFMSCTVSYILPDLRFLWRPAIIRSVKDATEQGVTHQQAIDLYLKPTEIIPL